MTVRTRTFSTLRGDSLLRNSAFVMLTTLVNAALGYVFWVGAARMLAVDAVGLATALVAALTVAAVVANLGLGSMMVQTLPRRASGRAWTVTVDAALLAAATLGLLLGAGVALVLPAVSSGFTPLRTDPLLATLFAFATSAWTTATVLDFVFIAERRASFMFARSVVFGGCKVAALLVVVAIGGTARTVVATWLFATVASLVVGLAILVPRLGRGPFVASGRVARTALEELRALGSATVRHHLIDVGAQLPAYFLPLIVVARDSTTANAYFSITWMIGSIFFTISPAVAASLFAEGSHDGRDLLALIRRSAGFIGALLGVVALVLGFGGRFILGFFGPGYVSEGSTLLLVLVVSALPDAVTNLFVAAARVRGRLGLAGALNIAMAVMALALAWWRVPIDGIVGAGFAWLGAQTAGAIVALFAFPSVVGAPGDPPDIRVDPETTRR